MDYIKRVLGFSREKERDGNETEQMIQYINLKLTALDLPVYDSGKETRFLDIAHDLIASYQEKSRLLADHLCPPDERIQQFLNNYLENVPGAPEIQLPVKTFILDHHGIARMLSLPPNKDAYISPLIHSYRVKQGVLHNPKNDRRTTKGVFHVVEGGLPIPDDKKAVSKLAFARLLATAFNPPESYLELPFTSASDKKAHSFVSLYLRPTVSPEIPGYSCRKSMEIRLFAPGSLVSNLDFAESIFGNAGDPLLPENDAALDVEHWSGHTGAIVLAPHLIHLTKKELGLPHISKASKREKRDGMCWEKEDELYNDGSAFKITARTDKGVIVTIIADNYFGYTKKEVKTQIGFAANLFGNVEEEHSGGAMAFPSYNLGDEFHNDTRVAQAGHSFAEMSKIFSDTMTIHPVGYATDIAYSDIIYLPENARINLNSQQICWEHDSQPQKLKLLREHTYFHPAGYKVRLEKNPEISAWSLAGTVAEGLFIHKPSTVSGGGKSEISKSIIDAILYGPYFVADFEKDFDVVNEIIHRDYGDRFQNKLPDNHVSRSVLSSERSLGSVIKLLTPSKDYTEDYNNWLNTIPLYIKGLVFMVKRLYRPEWDENWRQFFSVDIVNGKPGNELKFKNKKLVASYLRVGRTKDGFWRTFRLRQDFMAADKIQFEDDITASTVVPVQEFSVLPQVEGFHGLKFLENCEYRFFQRPDDAIHRGYDKQAESDLSKGNSFISNFEPLTREDAVALYEDAIGFEEFSPPMQKNIRKMTESTKWTYFVVSNKPRLVDGKPSKNVRYLQDRQDMVNPKQKYIAEMGIRLYRRIPQSQPLPFPVHSVLPGRRNNPPEPGIRALAVYNPIHYQELPELFMDFICSLTGKSPSTTGAGSEGAMTKGPFNALLPVHDINAALLSYILTGYHGYSTAAGYIGPDYRVDHDVSVLIPEIWSRLSAAERNPRFLIEKGYLEKLDDFDYEGRTILASRLGYRITSKFMHAFFGRIFENPRSVFSDEMLKPELQDMAVFADGIENIAEAQQRVAKAYFNDGSVVAAIPPVKAILDIMAYGSHNGKKADDPAIRQLFDYDYVVNSDWYNDRLLNKQLGDIQLWQNHYQYVKKFLSAIQDKGHPFQSELMQRLNLAEEMLKRYKSPQYLKRLKGMLGKEATYSIEE
jgi:phosphoenolpyruvate carboxykinase (diphosphate)